MTDSLPYLSKQLLGCGLFLAIVGMVIIMLVLMYDLLNDKIYFSRLKTVVIVWFVVAMLFIVSGIAISMYLSLNYKFVL